MAFAPHTFEYRQKPNKDNPDYPCVCVFFVNWAKTWSTWKINHNHKHSFFSLYQWHMQAHMENSLRIYGCREEPFHFNDRIILTIFFFVWKNNQCFITLCPHNRFLHRIKWWCIATETKNWMKFIWKRYRYYLFVVFILHN